MVSSEFRGPRDHLVKIYVRKKSCSTPNQDLNLNLSKHSSYQERKLTILWRGKVLRPTYSQLREFKGNCNMIASLLGAEEPLPHERNYHKIRIFWRGKVMLITHSQLLEAEGDLNRLSRKSSTKHHRYLFRESLVGEHSQLHAL